MSTNNPYRVNVTVSQVASNGQAVTAATFTYTDAATGTPLGSSQLGGSCLTIRFVAQAGQPVYDAIAYQLAAGSSAGVSLNGATTTPPGGPSFDTPAVQNVVTIPDAVGVQEGTVLHFSFDGMLFNSPDPEEQNQGR